MLSCVMALLLKIEDSARHSIVSMLSSERFHGISQVVIGTDLATKFRLMLFSASLAHTFKPSRGTDTMPNEGDLRRISFAMGFNLLARLDSTLAPHRLAKLSAGQVQTLTLVLFGLACAVAYCVSLYQSPELDPRIWLPPEDDGGPKSRTLWHAMQQHLSSMIAHYIVLFYSRLGFELPPSTERHIITSLNTELASGHGLRRQ
jgi:hypothetical protein